MAIRAINFIKIPCLLSNKIEIPTNKLPNPINSASPTNLIGLKKVNRATTAVTTIEHNNKRNVTDSPSPSKTPDDSISD